MGQGYLSKNSFFSIFCTYFSQSQKLRNKANQPAFYHWLPSLFQILEFAPVYQDHFRENAPIFLCVMSCVINVKYANVE